MSTESPACTATRRHSTCSTVADSFGRAKFRVRRYGQLPDVFLERKMRTSRLLAKRRTPVPIPELEHLANADRPRVWAGSWFADRLDLRRLAPTCQVSYRRTARVGSSPWGLMRLTVDDDLRGAPVRGFAFADGKGTPLLIHHAIVELKFSAAMPPLFQLFADRFEVLATSVSKYRLALSILHGLEGNREGTPSEGPTEPAVNRDTLIAQCSPPDVPAPERGVLVVL